MLHCLHLTAEYSCIIYVKLLFLLDNDKSCQPFIDFFCLLHIADLSTRLMRAPPKKKRNTNKLVEPLLESSFPNVQSVKFGILWLECVAAAVQNVK
jgi:hypothetical protein